MSPRAPKAPAATSDFLTLLPRTDRQRLLGGCKTVDLVLSDALHERGEPIRHVYFPIDSLVSMMTPIDGLTGFEVGMVGSEGMVGISLALGVAMAPQRALVQGSGSALRMPTAVFRRELKRSTALRRLLDRYLYVLLSQMALVGACTRFHLLESRVARWLLMMHDRSPGEKFHLTHVFFAHMLGVRREGITEAAGGLKDRSLISYTRGSISVRDRKGLEAVACTCYRTDKDLYAKMLGA